MEVKTLENILEGKVLKTLGCLFVKKQKKKDKSVNHIPSVIDTHILLTLDLWKMER